MQIDKVEDLKTYFNTPSNDYRPAPLWVWNDKMEPDRIRAQLREMADRGFGGAFVHPRPGLVTEYLSEEWFELWGIALEEAELLGLKLYIYDENSYPSGFAGGHVPSELPDCLANCVLFNEYSRDDLSALHHLTSPMLNRPGKPMRVFAMRERGATGEWEIIKDVTLLPIQDWELHGDKFWVFELGTPETNSWLGGFAYVDLLRPEVTERFLQTTHEQYRARFGDRFGNVIPALFTDEPEISPGNLFQHGDRFLPFSYWFSAEFEKRNHYDLLDYLPFLFRDVTWPSQTRDAEQVRYDYYATMHALWTVNSVQPISEWCERHHIAYTGHYLEHNWPHPFHRSSPSVMSMYEYMHWPAIDMLMTYLHKANSKESNSSFLHNTKQLMIGIREAHSVANQFDRPRVLCEAFGAGGWDSTFEDYKRIGDWLYVHGINFLNPHLTYSTIVGARKRDHPQSFDWRQPWWEELGDLNDYFGRLSSVLSRGKTENRILVLNPTTSSYLMNPKDLEDHDAYRLGIERTLELAQRLSDCGWDYDWGDEYILERHGSVFGNRVTVANRTYDVIIVPPAMSNLKGSTVLLLQQYAAGQGTVIAMNEHIQRQEGLLISSADLRLLTESWIKVTDYATADAAIRQVLQPRISWKSGVTERSSVAQLIREMEDGSTLYFIVNSSAVIMEDILQVQGTHGEIWDPLTGQMEEGVGHVVNGRLEMPICLQGSGSRLLRVMKGSVRVEESERLAEVAEGGSCIDLVPVLLDVTAERENMLPIFYCDLKIGSKSYSDIYTAQASRLAYEHHGFPMNPWDNSIQFKRRLLDREGAFEAQSGFTAVYKFHVCEDDIPSFIGLIVERPELYKISVNDVLISLHAGTCWLDHHMGQGSIREAIRPGDNMIRLEAKPFSIFMEIEAVYLTGDFTVIEHEGKWAIGANRKLAVGSWKDQGYPFYGSAVTYRYSVHVPSKGRATRLKLPEWQGTIASVQVNGAKAGLIGFDQNNILDITPYLAPDQENEVLIRVNGSFKNLLGPHFDPEKPRNKAWPGNWKNAPIFGQPLATEYDLLDYGLLKDGEFETEE
ncbi:glycosyl hydrolase [Paenibacillus qinlingensis]|uniref:glycosyl hydrolase n=1 Tax=Paenibacillus qinlingensis TaxID=1837343 RepID=UPI001564028D|nr:glycosyl hydrolase [Paenibacillus qinlingensis]NQX59843.1 hypothetical protein [Paenibacillus qinlingensis]